MFTNPLPKRTDELLTLEPETAGGDESYEKEKYPSTHEFNAAAISSFAVPKSMSQLLFPAYDFECQVTGSIAPLNAKMGELGCGYPNFFKPRDTALRAALLACVLVVVFVVVVLVVAAAVLVAVVVDKKILLIPPFR